MKGESEFVVVLTALDLEHRAVRKHLTDPRRTTKAGTVYWIGGLEGSRLRIALAPTGPGNLGAAAVAANSITAFAPRALLFVGVAGALKSDIEIGDVVVAERVYAYHSGKEQDGELLARPRSYEAPHGLLQFARDVARELSDGVPGPDGAPRRFGVHVKPIAAGEVVLDSAGGGTRDHLHRVYNDAAAIEMEGAGAAVAAHVGAVPALMVRGISDRADGAKGVADSGGSQPEAAENAAAFAMAFLRDWSTHGLHDSNDEPPAQQNIQNVAVQGDGVFNIVQGGDQYTYYLDASES